MTLTFAGTWSVLGLVYYVNRAYADGQLQTMLLPCRVCIGALLTISIHSHEVRTIWQRRSGLHEGRAIRKDEADSSRHASAFASRPRCSLQSRVGGQDPHQPSGREGFANYDFPTILRAIHTAQAYTRGKPGELTYLGENFNYVSLVTNVRSDTVLFPLPPDGLANAVIQIDCRYLEGHHSRWLVLSSFGLLIFGPNACGMYHPVALDELEYGQLQELR